MITSAINQQVEGGIVALDIKRAFDHVQWDGILEHFRSIGCRGWMHSLYQSYSPNRYIRVVNLFDSSDLYRISPLLFNLYIHLQLQLLVDRRQLLMFLCKWIIVHTI